MNKKIKLFFPFPHLTRSTYIKTYLDLLYYAIPFYTIHSKWVGMDNNSTESTEEKF